MTQPSICPQCGLKIEDSQCLCHLQKEQTLSEDEVQKLYGEYFTSGEKSFDQGEFEKAKSYFLKALSVQPESQDVTDRLKEVENHLRDGHFQRLLSEGKALMEKGRLGGAKAKLETALIFKKDSEIEAMVLELRKKVGEEEFRLFREEGMRFWKAGALRDAAECWEKALFLQEDPEIRELCEEIEGKLAQVQILLEEAQELGDRGEWTQALKHLEKGFSIYPEDHDLLVTGAVFGSHRDEYRKLWNQARQAEKRFRLIRAFLTYRLVFFYSPQDKKVGRKLIWIQLKIFLITLGATLLALWSLGIWR